jgi:hypothetical protein
VELRGARESLPALKISGISALWRKQGLSTWAVWLEKKGPLLATATSCTSGSPGASQQPPRRLAPATSEPDRISQRSLKASDCRKERNRACSPVRARLRPRLTCLGAFHGRGTEFGRVLHPGAARSSD